MNIIEFIYKLLEQFIPIPATRITQLRGDAEIWYKGLNEAPEEEGKTTWYSKYLTQLKKHGETWYFQTALALFFIFAVRWVHDFMNPNMDDSDDI